MEIKPKKTKIMYLAFDEPRGLTYHFSDIILYFLNNPPFNYELKYVTIEKENNKDLIKKVENKLCDYDSELTKRTKSKDLLDLDYSDIDIVHCNSYKALYYVLKLKNKFNFKVVLTLHAFFNGTIYKNIFTNLFTLFFINRIDHLHFLSFKSFQEFSKFNLPLKFFNINYSVFGLGINLQEFENEVVLPNELKHKLDTINSKKIVYLANFTKNKNHKKLLFAIKPILDNNNCVLLLFGEGKEEKKILSLIKTLNLEAKVFLFGRVKRQYIPTILKYCDIGVFYSKSENSPHGVLECLGAGLPVISTNVGNVTEVIQNFKTCFIVDLNDKNNFRNILTLLLNDSSLHEKLFKNITFFRSNFNWDNFIEKNYLLYNLIRGKNDK